MKAITRRALAFGAAALAVAPRPAPAQPSRNVLVGAFDAGPGGEPGNFNPLAATAGYTALNLTYEPLLIYTPSLDRIVGALAAGWESDADDTHYTFRLADGVQWQDGEKFTAADVLFTLGLAQDPKTGSVFARGLAGITAAAPDQRTVVLTLGHPDADLPDLLSRLMMLPRHLLEPLGRDGLSGNAWWTASPVGTGPFQITQYEPGQYVALKAFPAYRRGKPRLDGIINRYVKDSAAAAALRAGGIEFSALDAEAARGFAANPDFHVIDGPSWELTYIGFNFDAGLWDDARIRQAFIHAINREAIVRDACGGAAEVAGSLFTAPDLAPANLDKYAYDPPRARALLAAAGWAGINGGKPIPWLTREAGPSVAKAMAAMAAMLAEVGVDVVPLVVDAPAWRGIVDADKPDPSLYPLIFATGRNGPDPATVNDWIAESAIPPNGCNVARIRLPPLNVALAAALAEPDGPKRLESWREVAQVANREAAIVPLWVARRFGVVTANVKNFVWQPAPAGGPIEQRAELWSFG